MNTGRTKRIPVSRRGTLLLVVSVTVAILLQPVTAHAEEKTVEQLERAFTRQKDHRRRARMAMEILDARLNAIRGFVATGTMLEGRNPVLSAYDAAVSRLDEAVHAAAHVGTSKRVEVGLRRHMKELEQIRANVSAMERPLIEALAAHVVKIREAVLYSIMAPKK